MIINKCKWCWVKRTLKTLIFFSNETRGYMGGIVNLILYVYKQINNKKCLEKANNGRFYFHA